MRKKTAPWVHGFDSNRLILDYSRYIVTPDFMLVPEGQSREDSEKQFRYADAVYDHLQKTCPFCHVKCKEVWNVRRDSEFDQGMEEGCQVYHFCWSCGSCGWWCYAHEVVRNGDYQRRVRVALLHSFDVDSSQLPLEVLRREISRRPDVLHSIHPKKFEEFAASVLSDFLDVEVFVVGRSGDGGIDLVYMDGEVPMAVQVKRREKPGSVEQVKLVREFLGALLLSGFRQGSIITTASRFSRGAKEAACLASQEKIVDEFDLIDRDRFLSMFRFAHNSADLPWQVGIRDMLRYFE